MPAHPMVHPLEELVDLAKSVQRELRARYERCLQSCSYGSNGYINKSKANLDEDDYILLQGAELIRRSQTGWHVVAKMNPLAKASQNEFKDRSIFEALLGEQPIDHSDDTTQCATFCTHCQVSTGSATTCPNCARPTVPATPELMRNQEPEKPTEGTELKEVAEEETASTPTMAPAVPGAEPLGPPAPSEDTTPPPPAEPTPTPALQEPPASASVPDEIVAHFRHDGVLTPLTVAQFNVLMANGLLREYNKNHERTFKCALISEDAHGLGIKHRHEGVVILL